MDLTLKIGYNEIVNLVKQLQANKLRQLQVMITKDFILKRSYEEVSNLQHFLLDAPIMSDVEFSNFKENRKSFKNCYF